MMAEQPEPLPATMRELVARLEGLERRIAVLEGRTGGSSPLAEAAAQDDVATPSASPRWQATLVLAGRALLVLAGAYLVRALTDERVLPPAIGVGLAIVYAVFWQLHADRVAGAGSRASAAFHALASSLIAFPLIWETTARFGLLGPLAAHVVLLAFFALALAVAWRHRLLANAVATTALALSTSIALLSSTHDLLAAFLALLAIAAGLEWLAFRETWLGLRWTAALTLDGLALLTIAVATRPQPPAAYAALSAPYAAAALVLLPLLYMTSVAARTLRRDDAVTGFEVAQGLAAGGLGIGGAYAVLSAHRAAVAAPGALALLLGALCYGVAFAFVERRGARGRNFYFYSTAGGLLTLGGLTLADLGPALPLAWGLLGLAAAGLGRRFDRMTLRLHGALYLVAAATQAGLLLACSHGLMGRAGPAPAASAWGVALLAGAAWLLLATDAAAPRTGPARVPQLLLAALSVLAAAKALQSGLWTVLGDLPERDAGAAAVARTAVLAVLALALAWSTQRGRLPELGWLVYPTVALSGMKLVTQDLRDGRPATLVASLALYGVVLILAPRLMRPRQGPV